MRLFHLTNKKPLTIFRYSKGFYDDEGIWVDGKVTPILIEANIQPLKYHETLQFVESDRSKKWCKLWTESLVRSEKEGDNGWGADQFYWQGDLYEVRKTQKWDMGRLDHFHAQAVRIEITPSSPPQPETEQ